LEETKRELEATLKEQEQGLSRQKIQNTELIQKLETQVPSLSPAACLFFSFSFFYSFKGLCSPKAKHIQSLEEELREIKKVSEAKEMLVEQLSKGSIQSGDDVVSIENLLKIKSQLETVLLQSILSLFG